MKKSIPLGLAALGFIAFASGCNGNDGHNISWWQNQDTDKIESFLDQCKKDKNWNTECKIAYKALKLKQAGVNDTPKNEPASDD